MSTQVCSWTQIKKALTTTKLTPAEIKARLGKTGKLADLKERMAKLSNLKISPRSHHSASIMSPSKDPMIPRLGGGKGMSLDVVIPVSPSKMGSPIKSPMKASPRKRTVSKTLDLNDDANANLPIPKSYKFLEEVFRTVDHLVSIKFNRREVVKVTELKSSVQTALRKNFSDSYLRKIRCVFPQAFHYVWEHITGKFGLKKDDYELTMWPNMRYAEDLRNGTEAEAIFNPSQLETLSTKGLVERRKLFRRLLVSMVRDHHRNFLANLEPPIEVDETKLKRWHKMFDVETCPDVDMTPLPVKPDVAKVMKVSEVLTAKKDLFGINSRLENALKEQAARDAEKEKEERLNPPVAAPAPMMMKGLEGLPKALIAKIMAKEKAKQIKDMVENDSDRKEMEMLEDLVTVSRHFHLLCLALQQLKPPAI